jgi:RNA polymerase sigma-70 factor, ECF subfamily
MMSNVAEIVLTIDNLNLDPHSVDNTSQSITHLIKLAQAGDLTAFDQLIILYQNRVFATAWRLLGDKEDARDASQEVFLRVFKYLATFKTDKDFSAWLYRIIINACRDQVRKRGSKERMVSIDSDRDIETLDSLVSHEDLEASIIKSQEQMMVLRALKTLSEKERAAIVLRDMEGLSTSEVAEILGSSQSTVRSQICSARIKIKEFCDYLFATQNKAGKR